MAMLNNQMVVMALTCFLMFFAIYYKVVPTHVSEWLMFFGDEYWVKTGGCSYGL